MTLPWVSYRQVYNAAHSPTGVYGKAGTNDNSKDDVLNYQKALKKLVGLDYSSGPGIYGPRTKAATKKFQLKQGWTGSDADGIVGPETIKRVAHQSNMFNVRDWTVAKPAPPSTGGSGEPPANYSRTTFSGRTVNQRTVVLLARAQAICGPLSLSQGSYNRGVSTSAGTHDGGGVVDIANVGSMTYTRRLAVLKALRRVGFAAWIRSPSEGPWGWHIHAVAIGDREMSSAARSQVYSYFNGRNGLAGNGYDTAPATVGRPYPSWAARYR